MLKHLWIGKQGNFQLGCGIMGRRFPDEGLLRYRKWVPQQLGDVNKQESGDSRPIGARHGNTAANHTDLQSGCGRTCVFAVQVWSNLWDIIWLRTSHYAMLHLVPYETNFPIYVWWKCEMSRPAHSVRVQKIYRISHTFQWWEARTDLPV